MRVAALLLLVAALAGCETTPERSVITAERPPFDCALDQRCEQPCDKAAHWNLREDGHGDWDDLRLVAAQLAHSLATCDEQRRACAKCIDRAREASALK